MSRRGADAPSGAEGLSSGRSTPPEASSRWRVRGDSLANPASGNACSPSLDASAGPSGSGSAAGGRDSAADGSSAVGATDGCALVGVRDGRRTCIAPLPWSPEVSPGSSVTGGAESPWGAARRTSTFREVSNDPEATGGAGAREGAGAASTVVLPPVAGIASSSGATRAGGSPGRVPGGALARSPAGGAPVGAAPRAGVAVGHGPDSVREGVSKGVSAGESSTAEGGAGPAPWIAPGASRSALPGAGARAAAGRSGSSRARLPAGVAGAASRASSTSRPSEPAPSGPGSGANLEATTGCTRGRVPAPRLRPTSRVRKSVMPPPGRGRSDAGVPAGPGSPPPASRTPGPGCAPRAGGAWL